MDVNLWYDHDKFEGKNSFDLSVPCEWAQYKLYKNAWIVGIGPSKPKLWLIKLEQITTKPIAWMLIYDTITINYEGKNSFDWSVPCEWAQYKVYKKAWILSKQNLWLIEVEQITTKPIAWMLIYDTITTNFEGKNTFDLSVPCEWAHYKVYKNAWIVVIGPSKPKLWLIEVEQITIKPTSMDITLHYTTLHYTTLHYTTQHHTTPLHSAPLHSTLLHSTPLHSTMLIYDTITTNFEGKYTFDLSVPCEWVHYKYKKCL